jgi:hypothetical protein
LFEESLALVRTLGDMVDIALVLSSLGQLAQSERDFGRAAGLYQESLRIYGRQRSKPGLAWCLEELAGLLQAQGQPVQAARLFGAAAALREVLSAPSLPAAEHALAAARAQLDADTFAAAWEAGQAMTLEQAVAEALNQ